MPRLVEPKTAPLPEGWMSNGCFETMRAYRGRIFRLEPHLDRLYASVADLGVRAPGRRVLADRLVDALARSRLREAVVRVALRPQPPAARPFDSAQGSALSEVECAEPLIVVQPAQLVPEAMYRRGIRLAVGPARKFPVSTIDAQAKYSARLGSVLAVMDAQLRGADEALWLDAVGSVTESTASNFGIVRRGVVQTPPCWLGLLAGITRDVLFELAHGLRLRIEEVPLTRHDVYNADEAFLTSTLKEVLAVTTVDGRRIGTGWPGLVTQRLLRAFRALVRKECGR